MIGEVMTFHQVAIKEAFKYGNKYYRKIRADRAVEAVVETVYSHWKQQLKRKDNGSNRKSGNDGVEFLCNTQRLYGRRVVESAG